MSNPFVPPLDEPQSAEATLRTVVPSELWAESDNNADQYERVFIELLRSHLAPTKPTKLALDFAGGNGLATLTLRDSIPSDCRIVAISDDRARLRYFHQRLEDDNRREIFVRKQQRDRLPFALGTFDLAWGSFASEPFDPPRPILRQVLRVMRPGAQLLIAVPLVQTITELAKELVVRLENKATTELLRDMIVPPAGLSDPEGWRQTLIQCGAVEVEVRPAKAQLELVPPFRSDRLLGEHLLPVWLPENYSAQADLVSLLDQHVHEPLVVNAYVACVSGSRGMTDIADDSLGG